MVFRTLFIRVLLCLFLFAGTLDAQDAASSASATEQSETATEKLFYTATLNESVFINDKEALYNARTTVKVLQGVLNAVVFEVLGEGDIVAVNGEQIKDWSVRRAGAQTFVEIRPKQGMRVGETFNATIVGRKALELPATLVPMMFTGTDATAFSGLVRIVSTPDIRLYGKQSRGLMPIGAVEKNELAFSINGRPQLRLDVARGNELLAPVSLESFSLQGVVDGGAAHFRMHAVASVREIGAEIAVLSGEAALSNFAASSAFSVRTAIDEKTKLPVYYLKFPQRGDFEIDLEFDARILSEDGWRCLNFAVPGVQVALFSLKGLNGVLFAPASVSVPQLRNGAYEGFLPASGNFNLRWQEVSGTPREFSACVFSADSCSEWRISTGVLRQREAISLMISQGTLSHLEFALLGEGDVLNVSGEDVLAWSVDDAEGGERTLRVALSRKKRGAYTLAVETQSMFSALPTTFRPLRIVPAAKQPDAAVCVRFNEFLRVINDGAIRSEVLPQNGLTQVAESAFPQKDDFFKPVPASSEQMVYRISNSEKSLEVLVDAIRPDVSVAQAARCYFDSKRIVIASHLEMKIRSAPLYEWTILVPDGYNVSSVETECLAGYELSEEVKDGFRELKIVFTEPRLGEQNLYVGISKQTDAGSSEFSLQSLRYPQARFVRGFVGFVGAKNVRLIPSKLDGLSEVPLEFFPLKRGSSPQQVFRMREAAWGAEGDVEKMSPTLHGKVSTVYQIDRDVVRGNAILDCNGGSEAVDELQFELPKQAKFLRLENADIFFEPTEKDGVVTAQLRTPTQGKFSCRVYFEIPVDGEESVKLADFSGVRLRNVSGERGEIFVTSNEAIALAEPTSLKESAAVAKILRGDVAGEKFEARGGNVLLCAYQYVQRPFDLDLDFVLLPEKDFARCVVTRATGTLIKRKPLGGDYAAQVFFCCLRYLNDDAESLQLRLPKGTALSPTFARDWKECGDGVYEVPLQKGWGTIELELCGPALSPANEVLDLELPRVNVPVLSARLEGMGEFMGTTFSNGRKARLQWQSVLVSIPEKIRKSKMLIPAFCVFAGTLVILLSTRLRLFWRFLIGACSAVSLALVMMLESFILRGAVSPAYDFSVAAFGAKDVIAAKFIPWTSLGERLWGLDIGICMVIWGVGAFLLATGAVWRRSAILRFLGRVGFYGAFVCGTTDIEHRIPALIVAFLATELILLVIDCGFLLKTRFSRKPKTPEVPKESEKSTNSGGAALLAGTFALLSLLGGGTTELRANDLENELARPQEIAERISQSLTILPDRAVATGEIRLKGRAGERFDLLASPAVLTHFEKAEPGMPIRLERRHGKTGIVHQIVLDRSGTFSAQFAYELALRRDARGMTLPTGNAAADVVSVSLSRPDSCLGAAGEVTLALDSENGSLGNQSGKIVFKPIEERRVLWNPRERDRSNEALELFAESSDLYVPASGTIEGFHLLRLVPVQGEFAGVRIKIPEPFSVSRVEGSSIRRWNFGRDKVLTILLDSRKSEPVEFSIYTQAPLDITKVQQIASLKVLNCKDCVTTIGVATGDELQLDEVKAPELVSIDEKEFSPKLLERAQGSQPVFLRRAFRSVEGEAECSVAISEVKPNLRIVSKDRIVLNQDKISIAMDLTAEVSRADVFSLSFRLPEGLEVESVTGDALAYWSESQELGGERSVTLFLKKSLVGEEVFRIELAGAFPVGSPTWSVPRILFNDAHRQSGEFYLFTEEGLNLRMRSRSNLLEVSTADADDGDWTSDDESGSGEADFAFGYFGTRWEAVFAVGSSEKRSLAKWEMKVEPLEFLRYVGVRAACVYTVENATCQVIHVCLPESALAPRFNGDSIINATLEGPAENGGGNLWELRFAKPMRGDVHFEVEYFEVLNPTTQIAALSIPDALEEYGKLEIESAGVFVPPTESEFSKDANFAGKSLELKVAETVIDSWRQLKSDVREDAFSLPKIYRFSQLAPGGFVTAECIKLKVVKTDLVRLDASGTEILDVRVDGVPVNLSVAADGMGYLLLPKKADETPTQIDLLYRGVFAANGPCVVEPVRTSVYPTPEALKSLGRDVEGESEQDTEPCLTWYFSGNVAGESVEVSSIFGAPISKCRPASVPENLQKRLADEPISSPLRAFVQSRQQNAIFAGETTSYPQGDPGATVVFIKDRPATAKWANQELWAFGILAFIILLRLLIAAVFRKKRK